MTDSTGAVVWSADYKPFGEATITVNTITNNLRFPGQYYDQETGTHYNYFRDYNPVIGRYIAKDPIGLAGGINLYAYVLNKPTNNTDPYGLIIGSILGKIAPYISRATVEEVAVAGRIIDSAVGTALTFGAPEIPVGLQDSLGAALSVYGTFAGARTTTLGLAIASAAANTGAVGFAFGLVIAGGIEIGFNLNDLYKHFSGQDLGADIYDLLHPNEDKPLRTRQCP